MMLLTLGDVCVDSDNVAAASIVVSLIKPTELRLDVYLTLGSSQQSLHWISL